jgi:hypothetical protein
MSAEELAGSSAAELGDAIEQCHALQMALHHELLGFIREYDRREAWKEDGCPSMAVWLTLRLQVAHHTAREWVRVAHALVELPAIDALCDEGRLSWDQLAPLTLVATPDDDIEQAEEALVSSAAALARRARRSRTLTVADATAAHERRRFRWWWSTDGTTLRVSGALAPESGQTLIARLEQEAGRLLSPPGPDAVVESFEARCADALVGLASTAPADQGDADRAAVVVHVQEQDLAAGAEAAHGGELGDDGPTLAVETVRRLACDSRLEVVVDGADGAPVGVGRARRTVPAWMTRQLRRRDGGCVWPGCGRTRWLHAHHVIHWADGGPTDLGNLVLLCPLHHRMVHEGGRALPLPPTAQREHPPPEWRDLRHRLLALLPIERLPRAS